MIPATPFPTFGYFGPGYFCDREEELDILLSSFRGNQPTLLSGIRRLGKSGLLHHFIYHLQKNEVGIFVDLQGATHMQAFVTKLSEGILNTFSQEKKYQDLWNAIKKLRPSISFDEFTGMPQVSLQLSNEQEAEQSLSNLLRGLAARPERITLIFDEFQQVIHFEDTHMESVLRTEMQQYPSLHYVFSGSKTHLLSRIFHEAGRPFYGMVQSLHLDKLNPETYQKFIVSQFEQAGKEIHPGIAERIVRWTEAHTYYTQYVCNQLFLSSESKVQEDQFIGIQERILRSQSQDFYQIRDLLSPGQWKLLVATSQEGELYQPFAQEITRIYQLGNSNAIKKALAALLDKQLIHIAFNREGNKYYQASNPFLTNWIRKTFRN